MPLPFPFPLPFPVAALGSLEAELGAVLGVVVVGVLVDGGVLDVVVGADDVLGVVVLGEVRVVGGLSVVRSVVVTTEGGDRTAGGRSRGDDRCFRLGIPLDERTTPTMTPAVTARINSVIAKVRPAPGFGFSAGAGGITGTGCGSVAAAGRAAITSVLPVRASSTSAAVGRRAGSDWVMARNKGGQEPGRLSGTTGSRNSRATADSTALPGYSRRPVRLSSSTRPSA